LLLFLLCISLCSLAQDGVKLDLLKAPVSPASNLLGFATSDIDKPTDVSAFMLSLQTATQSFTKFPANYAVDIAPFLVNNKHSDLTTTGLQSTDFKQVFKQTFVLSAAIKSPDSLETNFNAKSTYAAFGFKFSILRGNYDETTTNALNQISAMQDIMLKHLEAATKKWKEKNDPEVQQLKLQRMQMTTGLTDPVELMKVVQSPAYRAIDSILSERLGNFSDEETKTVREDLNNKIKKIAADFQTSRVGFTWDFNAGLSGEFRNKKFNDSKMYNAGIWQTFGYTDKKGSSFLGLLRFQYNPDKVFAKDNAANDIGNISTFDAGARYIFSKAQSKFSCSAEAIYRSVLSSKTIDPSWRLILNADYAIFDNQKLTFSFGRNFDGTINKDGNLVAALGFLTGFGNKR
jgi:hypothetical protein